MMTRRVPAVIVALLLLLTLAAGVFGIGHEDSSIIYSYAETFAETGRIAYYPGGPRAEGATPFLWMVLLAALGKLGIPSHPATAILNAIALLLLVKKAESAPRPGGAPHLPYFTGAVCVFLFYALGTGGSGLAGFSTTFYCALLSIVAMDCCAAPRFSRLGWASAIALPLIRPDGLIYLAIVVGAATLFDLIAASRQFGAPIGWTRVKELFQPGRAAFVALAAALVFGLYWLWRRSYFGEDFPLPVYVKSVQERGELIAMLIERFNSSFSRAAGFLLFASFLLLKRMPRGDDEGASSRSVLFKLWWIGLSVWLGGNVFLSRFVLEQNIADRFHAPIFLLAALVFSWAVTKAGGLHLGGRTPVARSVLVVGAFVICLLIVGPSKARVWTATTFASAYKNNIVHLGRDLSEIQRSDAPLKSMLVTEAGRIVYYSKIPSIDAWGLNTKEYSRSPLLDPADVARLAPDLINIHGDAREASYAYLCENAPLGHERNWVDMTRAIFRGAQRGDYAVFSVPFHGPRVKNEVKRLLGREVDRSPPSRASRHDLYLVFERHPNFDRTKDAILRNYGVFLGSAEGLDCAAVLEGYRP